MIIHNIFFNGENDKMIAIIGGSGVDEIIEIKMTWIETLVPEFVYVILSKLISLSFLTQNEDYNFARLI